MPLHKASPPDPDEACDDDDHDSHDRSDHSDDDGALGGAGPTDEVRRGGERHEIDDDYFDESDDSYDDSEIVSEDDSAELDNDDEDDPTPYREDADWCYVGGDDEFWAHPKDIDANLCVSPLAQKARETMQELRAEIQANGGFAGSGSDKMVRI